MFLMKQYISMERYVCVAFLFSDDFFMSNKVSCFTSRVHPCKFSCKF